jgi:hypothetical protein
MNFLKWVFLIFFLIFTLTEYLQIVISSSVNI